MRRSHASRLIAIGLGGIVAGACSGQSPATPSPAAVTAAESDVRPSGAPPGVYELSFITTGHQPVVDATLLVNQELALQARVTTSAGVPVEAGSATFEECSLKGALAPRASCDSGQGTWKRMMTIELNSLGEAYAHFGFCSNPRTIGFRFRYNSQASGVASGTSESKDATWVAVQ